MKITPKVIRQFEKDVEKNGLENAIGLYTLDVLDELGEFKYSAKNFNRNLEKSEIKAGLIGAQWAMAQKLLRDIG